MKKTILSLIIASILLESPLLAFAVDMPVATSTGKKTQTGGTQEKQLARKLGQIKKNGKMTQQKIKTNINQTKAKKTVIKKQRAKVKNLRATKKAKRSATVTNSVR